tara:strand:- start:47 stop:226 length:180 start_codon:yes stop_codon:yes gene_type:complete
MSTRKPPLGLARKLRGDLHKITSGLPVKWVMVGELGLRHPDTAIETLDAALCWQSRRDG